MKRREITARLMGTFLSELEEQVAMMNHELLRLETAPLESAPLASLFRIAHTLKGASRAVDVRAVERICHALEALLQRMIDDASPAGRDQVSLLFAAADTLSETAGALRGGSEPDSVRIDTIVDALRSGTLAPLQPVGPAVSRGSPDAGAERAAREAPLPHPVAPGRNVRVDAGRLDELVAAITRLEAARGGLLTGQAELEQVHDVTARLAWTWRQLSRRLRRLDGIAGSTALATELDVTEDELRTLSELVAQLAGSSRRSTRAVVQASRDVAGCTRELRMRPFAESCEGLPRAVRDLAAAAGKEIRLELVGGDVEADRAVLDGLREPVLQLVRNAVDHGVETPAERARAGKPSAGHLVIAAALTGDRLEVSVSDDGRGLDLSAIRAELQHRGRDVPEDDAELARAIFEGGLSTRGDVTAISGRGVGLDVVRHAMEQMRGTVRVSWEAGAGTTFTMTCPPVLTIVRAVIVSVNTHLLAIPTSSVQQMLRVAAEDVRVAEGRQMLTSPAGPIPLARLSHLLPPLQEQPRNPRPVVVLRDGTHSLGLAVDELIAEQEIVLRPLDDIAGHPPHVSGAALLGPGRVALVLDAASLIGAAATEGAVAGHEEWSAEPHDAPTVLVVDDSITTRTLEQSILAAAGYRVVTAVDGADGWRLLRERGADLVVADVEMPRMDGFALCEAIRRSARFRELPVILVTALDSAEHRARGLEAGADAYIIKSGFDQQDLLDTVRQLLG